ncbi:hypothetical protein EJD96_00050 (plasmid) [Herbaspirillum seropedicae]|uniref:hypothetical protein n=1 Tax=Herbaspirillum seropedicae TaxID=964 RepID=UPI00111F8B5B|nr:hypothetical protein [Herbaspirillum seropedicae]QDD62645.1 hypothetical protein EJD96_00050 [Herbaspirillum seropedicae]
MKEHTEAGAKATENMSSVVSGAVKVMSGSFGSILESVKMVAAALAGGALFKETIADTVKEVGEVKKLANAFGETLEAANQMNIQLKLAGMTADDYTGIAMKFDKQLRSNEQGLNALGVVTRNSSNALLSQEQLLQNAVSTMMEFKAGTDRNAVAMAMFGKSAEDSYKLLKLNSEIQERATQLTSMGIGVSAEAAEAVKAYKLESATANIVLGEFSDKIGEAVLPGVTSMKSAFTDIAITILPVVQAAITVLGAAFEVLGAVVKAVCEIIREYVGYVGELIHTLFGWAMPNDIGVLKAIIATLVTPIYLLKGLFQELAQVVQTAMGVIMNTMLMFANVARKALALDFSGAVAAFNEGTEKIKGVVLKHSAEMVKIAEQTRDKIKAAWSGEEEGGHASKKGTKEYQGQDKIEKNTADKSRVAEWDAELNDRKVAYQKEHDLREMSKADEISYWRNILATTSTNAAETLAIRRKINQAQLEAMKKQRADEKALSTEKIDQTQRLAEAEIASAKDVLSTKKELGLITAQDELRGQIDLENQKYQVQLKALQDKMALYENDKVARQKALDEIQLLELTHAKSVQRIGQQIAIDQQKEMAQWVNPIKSAFSQSIAGIIQGTQTLQQAMSRIFQSILLEFVNNLVTKMVDRWIVGELTKRLFSQETLVMLGLEQKAAAAEQVATQQVAGVSGVMSNASIAAAAAMASVAAIPLIGWAMAPAVGAETYATAMAFLPSAAGGYDIPAGVNPLVQTHEKEMILPAKHADTIRRLGESGSGGGGGDTHYHINAMDARSLRDYLKANASSLAPSIKKINRNFTPVKG